MAEQKSGFYYPNKIARIYIEAIEKTIGTEAMKAVYRLGGLSPDKYPPPNNFAKAFDFADFTAIGIALERLYGPRGERSLCTQAGRVSFAGGLAEYGTLVGASDLAFKKLPLNIKLKLGLQAQVKTFNSFSDQICHVEEKETYFRYVIERCPMCWGRTSSYHVCYAAIGILEEGISWISNGKSFHLEEIECLAAGGEACVIKINKEPLS